MLDPTAEEVRLEQDRLKQAAWKRWGPYVSDRSWGTVREDYSPTATPGTTSPTTWPAARPIAGARTASPASATATSSSCFAPAFWNGRDPILKERLFGLTAARRQPRRGRQGILLLPRQHADALLHEVSLQVSAGGVSLRPADRGEPAAPATPGPNSSCSTRAFSTRTATSTSFIEYAKAEPEDICIRIEAFNRGPDAGAAAHPAAPLVPQHLGLGAAAAGRAGRSALGPAGHGVVCLVTDDTGAEPLRNLLRSRTASARATSTPPPAAPLCSPTTRPTAPASSAPAARTARPTSRTPSTATSSTARTASTREQVGTKAASITPVDASRPAARSCFRLRLTDQRRAGTRWPTSTAIVAQRRARPTSFTPPSIRRGDRRTSAGSSGRRWPGCSGPSRATSST